MKIYIISKENIQFNSIKGKIEKANIETEFENIDTMFNFKGIYNKKNDKDPLDELVIIDLPTMQEVEPAVFVDFENYAEENKLKVIKQSDSWNDILKDIKNAISQLKEEREALYQKQEMKIEQRRIDEPLHIYHTEKEVVTVEIPTYIEVPYPVEVTRKGFSLFNRSKSETKNVGINESGRKTITIGVVGTSRGAGATALCIELAEHLSSINKKVAVVERNETTPLSNMKSYKKKNVDILTCPLHSIDVKEYDYIILDFGIFFELTIKDATYICSTKEDVLKKEVMCGIEKKYCDRIILVTPANPWRLKEAEFYIKDLSCENETQDWIIYFNGNYKTKEFGDFLSLYEGSRNMVMSFDNESAISELVSLTF